MDLLTELYEKVMYDAITYTKSLLFLPTFLEIMEYSSDEIACHIVLDNIPR